jgi:NitT/TauT family transport system substrate-binding protein
VRPLPFLRVSSAVLLAAALAAAPGAALDKVTLATNWKAEAEHGGFYQAIATGIYRRHGLDVTLRMGGPQVNNPQLLAAAKSTSTSAPARSRP